MAKNISTLIINATAQKVWDTLTDPDLVKLWQYGSNLKTNWAIGSDIEFATEWQGTMFKQWGKVLTFDPFNSLSYSLFVPRPGLEDRPENYFVMHYIITGVDGKIKLEIIQKDNRPGAMQEEAQGDENLVLQALKNVAEADQ